MPPRKRGTMSNQTKEVYVTRNYKDTLFRLIFGEKENLLSLYNAVNETNYENPEELEIVTLENAIYMNVKNDIAFIIDLELHLYEHQSTFNANMPLRNLIYISRELEKLTKDQSFYASKRILIPTPRFVVFYNGVNKQPERQILKLSDAYQKSLEEPELELKVMMINVNKGNNQKLMDACNTLKEYSIYIEKVRTYAKHMEIKEAVERAVMESIEEDVLRDVLRKLRSEVIAMSIFEYDEEREMKMIRQVEREEGIQLGKELGIQEGTKLGIQEGTKLGIQEGTKLGIRKGKAEERERLLLLMERMYAAGEGEAVSRLSKEPDFLEEMLRTYEIE